MERRLEIGEEVLMFKLIYDDKGKIDLLKTFVYNTPKEVIVKKHDNVLDYDVITVKDRLDNEYCGSHFPNRHLGNIAFARREEYVNRLKDTYTKYYVEGYYCIHGLWSKEDVEMFRAINHQINCVCDHLFVMQREGCWCGGFHSSDYEYEQSTVTCVHCGLTNRWTKGFKSNLTIELKLRNAAFDDFLDIACNNGEVYYRGDESVVTNHLLSKRVRYFDNPRHLYSEAKKLKPDATNEELYDMMVQIEEEEFARNRKSWEEAKKNTGRVKTIGGRYYD